MRNVASSSPIPHSRHGGSALIAALWTILLLSVLVASFALDAMLEGKISVYVRQRRHVNYLTQSGVAIAEMLLLKQQTVSGGGFATDDEDRWKDAALRIKRGQTTIVDEPIGEDGMVRVEIIPEQARWNINQLCSSARSGIPYDQVWEQIFTMSRIPAEYFEELIDCWNDWTDADSIVTGRYGAEDEHYKSLDLPYTARNGPIDTVDELRLVKGFVPAILDGGVLNPEDKKERHIEVRGIKELFTTYGDGKINVNAAPMEVLMTIPGMDEIAAGAIIEEREGKGGSGVLSGVRSTTAAARAATMASGQEEDYSFKSVGDFMSRIQGLATSVEQYITVNSATFRVNIRGEAAGISHTIQAIVEIEGDKVRYLRWREDP